MSAKYIFVTGGVVSSLGKGLAAASIGCLLESRGLKVNLMKFDPYLNVDPGTMSPFQHGEVFVTDDELRLLPPHPADRSAGPAWPSVATSHLVDELPRVAAEVRAAVFVRPSPTGLLERSQMTLRPPSAPSY